MASETTAQSKEHTNVIVSIVADSKANLTSVDGNPVFGEYIPADNRDQENGSSSRGALAHLVKGSLGTGILAMPLAFASAGLVLGTVLTIFVGAICAHCVHILVKTSQEICSMVRQPFLCYSATAQQAFESGPKRLRGLSHCMKNIVDIGLFLTYYLTTVMYLVFIAKSFQAVMNERLGWDYSTRIYILICFGPIFIMGHVRSLKWLVPFSAVANCFIIVTFSITIYYIFKEPLDYSDKPLVRHLSNIPAFFATALFAMEGIGVVMPIENSMKRPQDFLGCPGVLNTAMFIVALLYGTTGFFGYARYGSECEPSLTLNLPKGEVLAETAKILMALAVACTFSLQFFVPCEVVWRKLKPSVSERNYNIAQIMMRTSLLVGGCILGIVVPEMSPFINFVGAVFLSLLGIMIPCAIESVHLWPNRLGFCKWRLIKNVLLSIGAMFALVTGAHDSILQIINIYT